MTERRLDYVCLQPTRQGQASYAHVNEIVAGLRARGWNVRLVEPPHPRPGRGDGLRRAVAAGTTQLAYWLSCRFRPAPYVYIRSHFLTLPTALLAKLAGSIVVQELNGPTDEALDAWPAMRPIRRLLDFLGRAQIQLADAVIVVTPGLADYVRVFARRRFEVHVIGNGANAELFRPIEDGTRWRDQGRPYAVFVGALASWQGIDTALAAAEDPAWPSGVDLVIAGDGRECGRVASAVAANRHIRWLGTIPYSDSPSLVAGSLVALVPKRGESFARTGLSPLKLYEAMSCGVPVVVSDLPGLADTVRDCDSGLTFAQGDAPALARGVALLAGDREAAAAMGARGREAVLRRYSWAVRAGETEKLLLDLGEKRVKAGR